MDAEELINEEFTKYSCIKIRYFFCEKSDLSCFCFVANEQGYIAGQELFAKFNFCFCFHNLNGGFVCRHGTSYTMHAAHHNFYKRGPKFDSVEVNRNGNTYYIKLALLFAVTIGEKSHNLVYLFFSALDLSFW